MATVPKYFMQKFSFPSKKKEEKGNEYKTYGLFESHLDGIDNMMNFIIYNNNIEYLCLSLLFYPRNIKYVNEY